MGVVFVAGGPTILDDPEIGPTELSLTVSSRSQPTFSRGQLGVSLTVKPLTVYPWNLLCFFLGILGDYNL